ncbi:transmembrane protein, putative [Medicago truncatula]|uniref:Transmembrane protein, putative n=1 Tax=Medicago truncatula TaxID=3880 RepID=A0A072TID1_MEDTR|nr:transmembrane protein, putative [Medicago truncatula]
MVSYSSTQPENVSIVNEAQKDMVWTSKMLNTYEDALMARSTSSTSWDNNLMYALILAFLPALALALTDVDRTIVGSFTVEVVVETIVVLGFSRNEDSMNSNFGDLILNKDYLT